jgi:hypothetical protein
MTGIVHELIALGRDTSLGPLFSTIGSFLICLWVVRVARHMVPELGTASDDDLRLIARLRAFIHVGSICAGACVIAKVLVVPWGLVVGRGSSIIWKAMGGLTG